MLSDYAFINVENVYDFISPSIVYKLIKAFEILFILSAGLFAYWTEGRFYATYNIKLMFAILLIWMTGHAIVSFIGGFSNAELVGPKGPVIWWSLLIIFVGYSRERWQTIVYPCIKIIVMVGTIEMVFRIFNLAELFDRVEAQRTLRISIRLMLWTAPLIFLVPNKSKIGKLYSVILLSLIALSALITATRSWLIICSIYMLAWITCIFRKLRRPETKITFLLLLVVVLLPVVLFLMYNIFETQIQNGGYLLSSRIAFDSRTWQLKQFFMNVPFESLMIGTGPRGTWRMGNRDYGYVDGVYLLLLFIGGLPLLISYMYIVVYPAIMCFFKKGFTLYGSLDFSCILVGTIWGIVMTGLGTYTAPELKLNHYMVLLCAGRCWSILNASHYKIHKNKHKVYP